MKKERASTSSRLGSDANGSLPCLNSYSQTPELHSLQNVSNASLLCLDTQEPGARDFTEKILSTSCIVQLSQLCITIWGINLFLQLLLRVYAYHTVVSEVSAKTCRPSALLDDLSSTEGPVLFIESFCNCRDNYSSFGTVAACMGRFLVQSCLESLHLVAHAR